MRVTVQPAADGYDMRGNWVTKRGGKREPSTKKSAAIRKAREMAKEGDTLVVKGTGGRILSGYPRTYRGSNSTTGRDDRSREKSQDRTDPRPVSEDFGFREPVEGNFVSDDFDENKKDSESVLDDLF